MNFELEEYIFNSSIKMSKQGDQMGQVPSIGRIIHVMVNREIVPAIITHVWTEDVVNATIFTKNGYTLMRGSLQRVEDFGQLAETQWRWPIQTPSMEELALKREDAVEARKVMLEETVNAAENEAAEKEAASIDGDLLS